MPKILCIDDGLSSSSIRHILEHAGCEVVSVSSTHALSMIARQTIDGVVLPYHQGDVDLLALRSRIRHLDPNLPLLLLSGGSAATGSLQMLASFIRENPMRQKLATQNA